ncbi:MAG TPA: hypothetical protein VGK67_30725 [Myxococcales bacterium]|jgi:hypothetical protein
MSPRLRQVGLTGLCLALCSCGVSRATVTALEADVKRERDEVQETRSLQRSMEAYVRGLKTNHFLAPYSFVYLGPGDLLQALSAFLPYRIPAKDLLGDAATGEIEVVSVNQPKLEARNRVRLQLTWAGRDVQAGDEGSAKVAEAFAAGVVAEIEASVAYDAVHRFASVTPRCLSVNLKKSDDPGTRSQILDLLNQRVFDRSVPVPIPPLNNQPAEAVFLTGDHVVVQYRQ